MTANLLDMNEFLDRQKLTVVFTSVLNFISEGILVLDERLSIIDANPIATKHWNTNILHKSFTSLLQEKDHFTPIFEDEKRMLQVIGKFIFNLKLNPILK